MAIRKIRITQLLGIDVERLGRQALIVTDEPVIEDSDAEPFTDEDEIEEPPKYAGHYIPAPDPCFGPARPVRDNWDDYHYEKYVIDNQSPDYHG
jgi:hypothetical protein